MNVMIQQPAGVAAPGQPQAYNPYGQPQPVVAPNLYTAVPQQSRPGFNPYGPVQPQILGVAMPAMAQPIYNPAVVPNPYISAVPYTPRVTAYAPQPVVEPTYAPILRQPQAYNPYGPTTSMQPVANPYVVPQHPGMPTYNPYTTVQPQANYSQNGIPSESEHIYNFLYSSSKTKEEIVDYIKNQDPFYSSQENGDITIYSTNIGIYFVCNNTITNSNFLEAVLKSALIRNYRILDNGYVAFISEIAISYTESITRDSIINFAKYLCKKNYLLTLRKEQFIFTNSGNLIFIDFSNLIPKEYMMGLEKYLYSPSGEVLYQEPSILFNNVDCLFIDILRKKYFKRNEIIEIEKRITNFNQLKRSVYR